MKTQIKFQKILALTTIIVAALTFIFALCFFSGNLSDVMAYRLSMLNTSYSGRYEGEVVRVVTAEYLSPVNDWILSAQATLSTLVTLSIIFFVVIAFIYITSMQSRRNYYVTNYVMTGIIVAYSLFIALFGLISMFTLMSEFMGLTFNFEGIEFAFLKDRARLPDVSYSPLMFVLGIVVYVLVIVVALAWIYNLIWKIKLMKGEKQLLSKGFVKEVA